MYGLIWLVYDKGDASGGQVAIIITYHLNKCVKNIIYIQKC